MKKIALLSVILLMSQLAFAGGGLEELLSQAKARVTTKRGAHARNELAHKLLIGEIDEEVIDLATSANQLMQVIEAHGADTLLGARARVLLASSRLSNLIADNLVTFEDIVAHLNEVAVAFDPDTREGAAARNNLAFMRLEGQVGDNLLTIDEIRKHLTDVVNAFRADDEVRVAILANTRIHLGRIPSEQEPETKKAKVEEEQVEAKELEDTDAQREPANQPINRIGFVNEPPPALPLPVFDVPVLDAHEVTNPLPEMFWGFNAAMPVILTLAAAASKK